MSTAVPKVVVDGACWAWNICGAVGIIFVNKLVMSRDGFGFRFATTLCAAHYLLCAATFRATQEMGYIKTAHLPFKDLLLYVCTSNASIVTLNLSLLLNKVGIYQIFKLANIPFMALVEAFWLGKRFSPRVICAMAVVIIGVAIVTVNDTVLEGNAVGIAMALGGVVSSGMQQIFCRTMQQKHGMSSHELLASTAPAQGWSLLAIGPMLDYYVVGMWLLDYQWRFAAAAAFGLSCALAVGVNLSQFVCLGRFSAVSYQVLGHSKTLVVLFGGWAFLGEVVTRRQVVGMAIAMAGMVAYGYFVSHEPPSEKVPSVKVPLLNTPSSVRRSSSKQKLLSPDGVPALNGGSFKVPVDDEERVPLIPFGKVAES